MLRYFGEVLLAQRGKNIRFAREKGLMVTRFLKHLGEKRGEGLSEF